MNKAIGIIQALVWLAILGCVAVMAHHHTSEVNAALAPLAILGVGCLVFGCAIAAREVK